MANIQEVAKRAGVSSTTVSHVINNTRVVTPETRQRVETAMRELGFRPNALARSLRRGHSHTLGLILPDSSNPFFAEVGRSLEAAAFASGYSVILGNAEGDLDRERFYVDTLYKKQVDGLVFVGAGDDPEAVAELLKRGIPVVVVDRPMTGLAVDTVLIDNRAGGSLATRHLIELGHRRIGCLRGPSNLTPSADRVTGYCDALAGAGLPYDASLVVRGDFKAESACHATMALLAGDDPPTAVFACNDVMAFGALRGAAKAGRRVPDDLAVVGFDDIELASYGMLPLTTVAQPKAELGRLAVQMLTERMADKTRAPRREVLGVQLIVRESSGGAR